MCLGLICNFRWRFIISSFGLMHLSTLLIGASCIAYGFMSHLHSSWVHKNEYKLCETSDKVWMNGKEVSCPDLALETAFLGMVTSCFVFSLVLYMCKIFCIGGGKSTTICYVAFLGTMAVALIIAGICFMRSAALIHNLPSPDYTTKARNIARVLMAAVRKEDKVNLISQSNEQTYFEEKITTGCLTCVNGLLHVLCGWLAFLDLRPTLI